MLRQKIPVIGGYFVKEVIASDNVSFRVPICIPRRLGPGSDYYYMAAVLGGEPKLCIQEEATEMGVLFDKGRSVGLYKRQRAP